jgi:hypothetical protein
LVTSKIFGSVQNQGTEEDLSALQNVGQRSGAGFPMSRSDGYRRFAAECMKIAHAAEDERQRAIFVQMATAWLSLAQRVETNADCVEGLNEETN